MTGRRIEVGENGYVDVDVENLGRGGRVAVAGLDGMLTPEEAARIGEALIACAKVARHNRNDRDGGL